MKHLTFLKGEKLAAAYWKQQGHGESTIRTKAANLKVLELYFIEKNIMDMREVTRSDLTDFLLWLRRKETRWGGSFTALSQRTILTAVKQYFICLYENDMILRNPSENLVLTSKINSVKVVLTEKETFFFLDSIEPNHKLGLRDRTLFELIYSSGLRASEAANLIVEDYDRPSRLLWVRKSKFTKDRRVPVTKAAAFFLDRYLVNTKVPHRPLILSGGYRFTTSGINTRFKLLAKKAGLYRKGLTVHSLRHGCATHLLAHGADIRYVQELLGHESVETTVVYSHQNEENLKAAYRQYHPRENIYFTEISREYQADLQTLVNDSLRQREKNRKRLARSRGK